jgi:hypothetical protein
VGVGVSAEPPAGFEQRDPIGRDRTYPAVSPLMPPPMTAILRPVT